MTSVISRPILIQRPDGAPTLSCDLAGDDPRFLFVHGACSSMVTWLPVVNELAGLGESAIALDLRGHGRSAGKENLQRYRIEDYVEDVVSVIKAHPSIKILVGHSMGGLIGQFVASQVRIGHLILVASSPVGGMLKDGIRMFLHHPASISTVCLTRNFARLYKVPAVARSLLFHPSTPNQVVQDYLATLQDESWLAGNELVWRLPTPGKVSCPVSVLGGTHDAMISPASVSATARAYNVKPIFVERTAHMLPIEAEPQTFAKLLIECAENEGRRG